MRYLFLPTVLLTLLAQTALAQLRFERKPIQYSKSIASDPVALLVNRIQRRECSLRSDDKFGYLVAILDSLDIPVSSQTLVFSKTSLQRHLISPSNPRAIYFNDDTYVAWVPDGKMVEIASVDPSLGTIFYTIDQPSVDGETETPEIVRVNQRCLFCHATTDTGRVPGLLMQSVYTDSGGNRVFSADAIPTDSKGPLQGRWAGWFVTGSHGGQRHLGNLTINEGESITVEDTEKSANVIDLSQWFDVEKYLTPHSDIVALLVLRHQVTVHNLLIDANHRATEHLFKQTSGDKVADSANSEASDDLDQLAEQIVDGLLMVDRAEFSDPIEGTSSFAKDFVDQGRKDGRGRSLRDLDLETSLFQYSCSYLIYTESFDVLPQPLLARTYERLLNVLKSADNRDKYTHLSSKQRLAILQILRDTKSNLPRAWKSKMMDSHGDM